MGVFRDDVRALFAFRRSPVRWPIGLQAAISVAVPLAAFQLAGYEELGLMASMGAFVSLYSAAMSRVRRAQVLPIIILGMIAASALGVATSHSLALGLVTLFVVASVASVLCLGARIGPPGPVFFVLIAGVSGYLAAPPEFGGVERDPFAIISMVSVGSVFAYLVVLAPLLVTKYRKRELERFASEEVRSHPRFAFDHESGPIAARIITATGIAALVSAPLGIDRAYWVFVAVVAVLQNFAHIRVTAIRGVHRGLGTFVGVGAYALVAVLHPQGLWLAATLGVLQFTVELLVTRNYGLALVFITPLALLISTYGTGTDVDAVVRERAIDTVIGVAIALGVLLLAWVVRRILSARISRLPSNGRG